MITIDGELARIQFDRFDLDNYALFLKAKQLPESQVTFDWEADRYELTTPARFAPRLGVTLPEVDRVATAVNAAPHLFDYQAWAVDQAIAAKRFALWLDTGLGKTASFLDWARRVQDLTGGRVLILTPLAIIPQVIAEAERFYGGAMPITHLRTRDELIAWCKTPTGDGDTPWGICNYEKFIPDVIPELRHLAGLVADESSMLKTGGGTIKWNLIKSARGIEYKLSCTATPAPNDAMEYASQAAFLEKLRTEGEILWTYFSKDKYGNWSIKPHARAAFYAFMASWSVYLRDPKAFGFADILATLPPPVIVEERLPLTDDQRERMTAYLVERKIGLFADERLGIKERSKLAQMARGFVYEGTGKDRTITLVDSEKVRRVADIVWMEIEYGQPTLIWTTFDEEAERILAALPPEVRERIGVLTGSQSEDERRWLLEWFSGKRCICNDPVFRAKFSTWKTSRNTSARIGSGSASGAESTWPGTTETIPKSSARRESNGTDTTPGAEINTPLIPSFESALSTELPNTGDATRTIDSPRGSRHTASRSMSTERRKRRDASSVGNPLTQSNGAGDPDSITATSRVRSGDSSATIATSGLASSEMIQTPSNAPRCTCGQQTGGRALISKPSLVGYGLNLQFVKAMVFSGFDDSFERAYQAVRRAYRFGQIDPVRVYWPYVPELEGLVFGNIRQKEARFLEEVAAQEALYRRALSDALPVGEVA